MSKGENSNASLFEALASLEHERWARWQKYVHEKGRLQADGSMLLPAELVSRWERQMSTPYEELAELEKDSDREQVRSYFPLLERWMEERIKGTGES